MNQQFMDLFNRIDKVEQVLFNIDQSASITSLVAENISSNDESSALYGVQSLLKMTSHMVEDELSELRREIYLLATSKPVQPAKKRGRPAKKKRGRPRKVVEAEVV